MKVKLQSYFSNNKSGKSIYKIEMDNIDCSAWLKFHCEIEIEYDKHPDMKKSIAEISSPDTSPEKEMDIIQEILSQVTTIEGIKKCKIYESNISEKEESDQRFHEFLTEFVMQEGIGQYTPLSAMKNPFYFRKFEHKLTPYLTDMVEINKSIFEAMISGYPDLEEEYISCYSSNATFYMASMQDDNIRYEFYFMKTNRIVLMFFSEV